MYSYASTTPRPRDDFDFTNVFARHPRSASVAMSRFAAGIWYDVPPSNRIWISAARRSVSGRRGPSLRSRRAARHTSRHRNFFIASLYAGWLMSPRAYCPFKWAGGAPIVSAFSKTRNIRAFTVASPNRKRGGQLTIRRDPNSRRSSPRLQRTSVRRSPSVDNRCDPPYTHLRTSRVSTDAQRTHSAQPGDGRTL